MRTRRSSSRSQGDLVDQGRRLYWGVSEWNNEQIERATSCARTRAGTAHLEPAAYNMLERHWERDAFP